MNRGFRVTLITMGCLLGIGIALTVIAAVMGGGAQAYAMVSESGEGWSIGLEDIGIPKKVVGSDLNKNHDEFKGAEKFSFNSNDITSLMVDCAAVEIDFEEGSADKITVDAVTTGKVRYQVYTEGNDLMIRSRIDKVNPGNNVLKLRIGLPKDKKYECFKLEMAAGSIEGPVNIICDTFDVDMAAGKIKVSGINTKDMDVDMAAGELVLDNVYAVDANIDASMGEVIINGDVSGDLDADLSMGDLTMTLDSAENSHNYKCDSGVGNLSVGSSIQSNFAGDSQIDNGSDSDYNISCAMGNVTINFANNR